LLAVIGIKATMMVAGALVAYITYRMLQRWLFIKSLRVARVNVQELHDLIRRGDKPIVLDVRTPAHRRLDSRKIPGAQAVDLDNIECTLAPIPHDREMVVYCACPNEASAAKVTLQLRSRGFYHVRPLAGGIDAWASAGLPIERYVSEVAADYAGASVDGAILR
jgi:rhodanese-related sulfurtransferase